MPSNTPSTVASSCVDQNSSCTSWASHGYCLGVTKDWMSSNCARSCTPACSGDTTAKQAPIVFVGNTPPPQQASPTVASNVPSPQPVNSSCVDLNASCASWAAQGYCLGATKDWMSTNCARSCTPACSAPTSGDAATKQPPSMVAISSSSSASSATPPPPPATFTACIQNSTPDPTFKAIRQLKKCSELLSQSQVDQDHFYPPQRTAALSALQEPWALRFRRKYQENVPCDVLQRTTQAQASTTLRWWHRRAMLSGDDQRVLHRPHQLPASRHAAVHVPRRL